MARITFGTPDWNFGRKKIMTLKFRKLVSVVQGEVPAYSLPVKYQEPTFENVEAFVRGQGQAACFELCKAFGVSYGGAVKLMDALEERGVVNPPFAPDGSILSGPRPINPA